MPPRDERCRRGRCGHRGAARSRECPGDRQLCNVDVIGHIENPDAIRMAVETVDTQAGRIVEAAREAGVTVVVTADHGTVERWYYPDGTIDTGHTDSPVPFILIDPELGERCRAARRGRADRRGAHGAAPAGPAPAGGDDRRRACCTCPRPAGKVPRASAASCCSSLTAGGSAMAVLAT